MFVLVSLLAAVLAATVSPAAPAQPMLVEDGESAAAWRAMPADGVELRIGTDAGEHGRALRLDFNFKSGGGYAVAHRAVSLDLPANYRFRFRLKGACRPNNLEFKLLDASGENVWWCNQRDFAFPTSWQTVTVQKRHLSFAWGPQGGGELRHVAAVEFAVTAGQGGQGTVWIDDLELQELPPPDERPRAIVATSASNGRSAPLAVDSLATTAWVSRPRDVAPVLQLDLGTEREFGGLVLDWLPGRHAADYVVELSSDAKRWQRVQDVRGSNGGRDHLFLPESQARYVRLGVSRPASPTGEVALASVAVKPLAWSASRNDFFAAIAAEAPRGNFPRSLLGEMTYWTVVGQDFDTAEGLMDEYGRVESGKGAFSIEPFLRTGGRLLGWNDVRATQALRDGRLPVPVVEWAQGDVRLSVTAFGVGQPDHSALLVRYRVRNVGTAARVDTLYLALRPFQVNPPTQFLNTTGGVAPIRELAWDERVVRVNGDRGLSSLTPPDGFGAVAFAQGDIVDFLREGRLPPAARMPDPFGAASGALAYVLPLQPGGEREVVITIPLHERPEEPAIRGDQGTVRHYADALQVAGEARWKSRQDQVGIELPDTNVVQALKAQLAWVLINRSGPAIQPGVRSYARSWIRDGALTSSALLRLGEMQAVREFIEWFVPHQYENGKVPCCVDARGADPVPEHDSSGELIYLITEYYRYTGDRAFAERMWPHVAAATAWLDSLRAQRRTPEWRTPENARYFGLLPPSISHEGYSAKPMHSYWDDFWALRGFKDAAFLAGVLGRDERAALERDRDQFQADLVASLEAAMRATGIDFLPGCADLGDFDATSTSIGLAPADAAGILPRGALERTFEKYWGNFSRRSSGAESWEAYTPYEWRNVGAMVRLGWRDRSNEALQWFLGHRRPLGWQQWAEVVWKDERLARFIGDMPHTWCGTDYVRSVLDMLAYESEADSSLVIGAGVPKAWLADSGVTVRGLHTRWGTLSYSMRETPRGGVIVRVLSTDLRVPPGGIVVAAPHSEGDLLRWDDRDSTLKETVEAMSSLAAIPDPVVRTLPATLHWEPRSQFGGPPVKLH